MPSSKNQLQIDDAKDAMMQLSRPRIAPTKVKVEAPRKATSAAKDPIANLFNLFSSEGSTSSLHSRGNVMGNIADPFEVTFPEGHHSRSSVHSSRFEENKILSRTSGFEDALRVHFPFALEDPKTMKFNFEPSSYFDNFNELDQFKDANDQNYEASLQVNQTIPYTRADDNFRRYMELTPALIRQKAAELNYEEQTSSMIRGGRTNTKTRAIFYDQETTIKKEYQHHRTMLEESMLTLDRTNIGDQTKLTVARIKKLREMKGTQESKNMSEVMGETLNEELGAIYEFAMTGKANETIDNFMRAHAQLEENIRRREVNTNASWGKEQVRHAAERSATPQFDRESLQSFGQRELEHVSQQKSDYLGGFDFSTDKKPAVQIDFLSHLVDHDNLMTIEETANDYTSKPITDTRVDPQLYSYEIGQTQFNREKNMTSRAGEPILEKEKQLDEYIFEHPIPAHDRVVLHQASPEQFMDIHITKD